MTSRHSAHNVTDEKLVFPALDQPFDRFSYGQTQSSPYELPLVTISFGADRYGIPRSYLDDHPRLIQLQRNGAIQIPVSADIGHTIVHFLYTGKWQTIDSRTAHQHTFMEREYQRCVQVYHASIKYDLSDLKTMAEKYIAYFGSGYSAMELLRLTTEVFSELPEDEFWLPKFVTNTLQEMASRGKPKVNIRDSSTVSKAGSLAIMAAVIEAQSSHIMELESRITFQIRTGVTRRDHGPGYYPYLYNPYPRYPRPVSPSSAANSTSPRAPRYHRPASPSSAAYSASVGARRYARSASPGSEGSDVVGESVITPDESSEDSAPTKDSFFLEVTKDRSHEKEGTGRPDSPVLKEPVTVFVYEESVVEAVEASVYEESIAENSVNEEAFTEERQPVDEESVEEFIYEEHAWDEPAAEEPAAEEPTWDEPAAEEPAPEEPVPVEIVAEPIAPETNRPHSLLLNSDLYKDWKTLSPKKRRMRTKRLVRQGLPVPDKDGVISMTLA